MTIHTLTCLIYYIWTVVLVRKGSLFNIPTSLFHIPTGFAYSSTTHRTVMREKFGFFTQGQFWPSGIVVACMWLCVCVHVSVNHEFVRTITHQPFKLGSPNLDQRCKRPWLRSLLFRGVIDGDLQGQIKLQSQHLPHFELVHAITHHQLKL